MKILVVNAGSSSLKCSLFIEEDGGGLPCVWTEQIDWSEPAGHLPGGKDTGTKGQPPGDNRAAAARSLLSKLWTSNNPLISAASEIDLVGHRVVHGGGKYYSPTLISDRVVEDLHEYVQLAPTHEPVNIEGIEIASKIFKNARQVAVFDTAYHHQMPEAAVIYPGPYKWYQELGLRRFGFHGISHQYCLERAAELVGKTPASLRAITCHLGNGASLAAAKNGACQMTSMGFTPLEGLVMGSRSGTIDPGMILYLLQKGHYDAAGLSDVLNNESGLKGISGISADMRAIEKEARAGNHRAELAFEVYIRSLAAHISSLLPLLGGLDVLVFTGGVGENSAGVREASCQRLAFLGVDIDSSKNQGCKPDMDISSSVASVKTLVIHTREDLAIARACLQIATSLVE